MFNLTIQLLLWPFGSVVEKAKSDGKIGELMLEWYDMIIILCMTL